MTTAAQDADVVKDRPNLAASEFEAITSQYKGAPLPENENERYASLCRLEQMDTPEDPRFDDITALVRTGLVVALRSCTCHSQSCQLVHCQHT